MEMDEKTFRWMMNEDAMATEKLAEGIRNFSKVTERERERGGRGERRKEKGEEVHREPRKEGEKTPTCSVCYCIVFGNRA